MTLLRPEPGDLCPCGSTKKYKKCHGAEGVALPAIAEDERVDPLLVSLAENVLSILRGAIESVEIPEPDDKNAEEAFRKQTVVYFAKKCYRATLAGLTLIRAGQTTQALTLKRDQFYSWVAFHYYLGNEPESVLFTASGPLRQRDKATEIVGFDDDAKADPARQRQLKVLEETADGAYRRFPALQVVKGDSGKSDNPKLIDWSEPSVANMLKAIVRTWPEQMAEYGHVIPEDEVEEWCRKRAQRVRFFHSDFPSQDSHGTPMGLVGDLNSNEDSNPHDLNLASSEPNGAIYIYQWYAMGVAQELVKFAQADGFKNRFVKLYGALNTFKAVIDPKSDIVLGD